MSGVELIDIQHGVVSRAQALRLGWTDDQVRHRVRAGRWRGLHPGVYLTHSGEADAMARVWAALLHGGPDAVVSFQTAGWLQGLIDDEPVQVHITAMAPHRITRRPGVRIHRSRRLDERRHTAGTVPQTTVEDTVLDLVDSTRLPEDATAWLLRACQRRLTTPSRLRVAAARRRRLRHRALVKAMLFEAAQGVASTLELRYRRDVELAHDLPRAERGGRTIGRDGRRRYFDVRYRRWRTRVELEGLAFHPDDRSWSDAARDNQATLSGDVVLRYGWREVAGAACETAAEVAAVLSTHGWTGQLRPCGPGCRAARQVRRPA